MAQAVTHRDINTHDETDHHKQRRDSAEHAVVDKSLQQSKFGGFHFGSAFFGWLVATGMAALLTALLAAAGSAVALTAIDGAVGTDTAETVGLISGITFVIALGLAYYAGGYVAGRMARSDGGRQGFGVWAIGIGLTILLGLAGAILGAQFNVLQQLNLPRLPINEGTLSTGGLLTLLATAVITLLAAIAGGKQGKHYHDKIDDMGTVGITRE